MLAYTQSNDEDLREKRAFHSDLLQSDWSILTMGVPIESQVSMYDVAEIERGL